MCEFYLTSKIATKIFYYFLPWVGDLGLISGSGKSSGEGTGNPLQCSCLENPMDGGAWWATVHRVAKSQTRLTNTTQQHTYIRLLITQGIQVHSLAQTEPLEEDTATHSSILAWEIPWTEEPGGLQSTGSQRVGHD